MRSSFSGCFIIFRFVFLTSSIDSHHTYLRFFLPLGKGILVDFLHPPRFCASTGIFQLWSWIERNWDWGKPCGLKRLLWKDCGGRTPRTPLYCILEINKNYLIHCKGLVSLLTWMRFIIKMKKVLLKPIKLIFVWWGNQKLELFQRAWCGMGWSFYRDWGNEKNCGVPLKIEGTDTFCTLCIAPPSYCM